MWRIHAGRSRSALIVVSVLTRATTSRNLEDIMSSEISQSQKVILGDSTYTRILEWSNSQRQEVKWWMPGAGGRGERSVSVSGYGVSVWEDKKVLEMEGGTCMCKEVNTLNTTDLHTLNTANMVSYVLYVFLAHTFRKTRAYGQTRLGGEP